MKNAVGFVITLALIGVLVSTHFQAPGRKGDPQLSVAADHMCYIEEDGEHTGIGGFVLNTMDRVVLLLLEEPHCTSITIQWKGPCPFCGDKNPFAVYFINPVPVTDELRRLLKLHANSLLNGH